GEDTTAATRLRDGECLPGYRHCSAASAGAVVRGHDEADGAVAGAARAGGNDDPVGIAFRRPVATALCRDIHAAAATARAEVLAGGRECERAVAAPGLRDGEGLPGDCQRAGARTGAGVGGDRVTDRAVAAATRA